jgi:hypothetical protein
MTKQFIENQGTALRLIERVQEQRVRISSL